MSAVPERRSAVRVGCSGFVYRDWRGVVYPEGLPQRSWFGHYATLFDTVELNNTFYRSPRSRLPSVTRSSSGTRAGSSTRSMSCFAHTASRS